MTRRLLLSLLTTLAVCAAAITAQAADLPHYDVRVRLDPTAHRIVGDVDVSLPASITGDPTFVLHGGLVVTSRNSTETLERLDRIPTPSLFGINEEGTGVADVPLVGYRVRGVEASPQRVLRLSIDGAIHHPLATEGEEYARSFSRTPGIISEEGVVLSASSWWLPSFGDGLVTFKLQVDVPPSWDAVSEGQRTEHEADPTRRRVVWDSPEPMEEVHLIAAEFTTYTSSAGKKNDVATYAFLRTPDPNLANKYLEATASYLTMYEELFGAYPFGKFALVENFWDTGYGMPSFTLLGDRIIRFPFILTSSYPHEILHNWWGNGVYVDYPKGNWCEGLTAYLADHLFKEGQGGGAAYRRDSLKRYTDHVRGERDFPLTEFRSRHSSATEAVGYGKSLMLWHMVRVKLGDDAFAKGLREFYKAHKFEKATFDDLEAAFSAAAAQDLAPMFEQWVERTGAPVLELTAVTQTDDGARIEVRQVPDAEGGAPYQLDVPVALWWRGHERPQLASLSLTATSSALVVATEGRTLDRVAVDPSFDLFRRLHRSEIPPSLSELFGADRITMVLPRKDPSMPASAWSLVTSAWSQGGSEDIQIVHDDELDGLPQDRAVWLFGADNQLAAKLRDALRARGASTTANTLAFGPSAQPLGRDDHSFVYVERHPTDPNLSVGWVGADRVAALPGLARKLPHYGKYSFLAFVGDEPSNVRKGQWPVTDSPLVWQREDATGPFADLPAREPLARPAPAFNAERLAQHVARLSAPELEGRGVGTSGIEKAEQYIADELRAAGLEPGGDEGSYFQNWAELGGPDGKPVALRNVVAILRGTDPEWSTQSAVLGAHHDHLGRGWPDVRRGNEGTIHPGADDNASGVAVLLEVARSLGQSLKPKRTLVFTTFSGEEWKLKGSAHYIDAMKAWPAKDVLAMINLDTVGRLGDNAIKVFGSGSATEWVHVNMGIGFTTGIKSESVMDDLGASDQKSFLDAGVPAVQVFAGANEDYHRPSDTADKIDADGMVKIATWVREAMGYLSERDRPFTSTLQPKDEGDTARTDAPQPSSQSSRRVSLGTLPDFGFAGPGVMVTKVMPGTPAERAGLEAGDRLIAIDEEVLENLRGYSNVLKKHGPGDEVTILLERDGAELTVRATLVAR